MTWFMRISSSLRVDIDKRRLGLALLVIIPSIFAVGLLFYNNLVLAGILCVFVFPVLKIYERILHEKWKNRLLVGFMEVLTSLNASFQMGYDMDSALEASYKNLKGLYPDDEPIMKELDHMLTQKKLGIFSIKSLFYDLAKRSQISEMVDFVDVYYTAVAVGGDICTLSSDTARIISEKLRVQNEIRVMNAQKKYESMLLMLLPIIILLFLRVSSPGYLDKLYGTPMGVVIMSIALGLIYFSYFLSERILDIDV